MKITLALLPTLIAIAGTILGAVLWFYPATPTGDLTNLSRIASVVVIALSLWASRLIPEYFTAIIFFLLAMLLTNARPEVVFSGFHSTAVWMIFGGLILGIAVQESGLGKILAKSLLKVVPNNYFGILFGITLLGTLLCFIIPSNTGRIVIMMPIFIALAEQIGLSPESRGRTGLLLAVAAGSIYPSLAVMPAAVPNLAWLGAIENIHEIKITYAEYLIANFPVIGSISLIFIPFICKALFPDKIRRESTNNETIVGSGAIKRLTVILTVALTLWITDFYHGVSPAWVALGAATICMLPRIGVIPSSVMIGKISYAPWFFVAGVIGMGGVVADSGLGAHISKILFNFVPLSKGQDFSNFFIVTGVNMVVGLVTTIPGQPAIMTTLAAEISHSTGWSIKTVLMTQPLSWTMALFAYQLPPFILAANLGEISFKAIAKLIFSMFAVAWIIMTPLIFLWWKAIGYL